MFIIYKHTNKTTGKCYVGWTSKSLEERWRKHVSCSRSSKYHFHRAIALYGESDWISEQLQVVETQQLALQAEMKWIAQFKSDNPEFGYNSSSGGESCVPNAQTRLRLSEAQRKRFSNPEERLKTSRGSKKRPPITNETRNLLRNSKLGEKNPQYGRVGEQAARHGKFHSEETKLKIARKKKGQRLSDEAKRKCSEASKKRWEKKREQSSEISTAPEIQATD